MEEKTQKSIAEISQEIDKNLNSHNQFLHKSLQYINNGKKNESLLSLNLSIGYLITIRQIIEDEIPDNDIQEDEINELELESK